MPELIEETKLEEYFPQGKAQGQESRDLVVYEYMKRLLRVELLYDRDEIYDLLVANGVQQALTRRGFPQLIRYGGRKQTTLTMVMNNLWWSQKARKFAKGIYVRSGRPYGVKWLISGG